MPKYIQIVAPVSGGLILDGSITTAKLAATLDLSGKTITYRSIVNADISATAAIALTKLASIPVPSLQRASGTVTLTGNSLAQDSDIVTITPTRLPSDIVVIGTVVETSGAGSGNYTMKVCDNANIILTTGSVVAVDTGAGIGNSLNSLSYPGSYNKNNMFVFIAIIAAGVSTPIHVRATLPATITAGSYVCSAEIEVIS